MSADRNAVAKIVVLRKTRYQESGLIVASISPSAGRLDFLVRGAQKVGGKKYPEIDLFRELEVRYRDKDHGLLTPLSIELIESNDAIAGNVGAFMRMGKLAAFLLRNSHPHVPCPTVYAALRRALASHLQPQTMERPWESLVRLVYLDENGLLSGSLAHGDGEADDESRREALTRLIGFAVSGENEPAFSSRFWRRLSEWVDALCVYHGLEKP